MTKEFKAIIKEVHGQSYVDLMDKREEDIQTSERNAKLCIIEDINKARRLMGCNPCVDNVFYSLYDMNISELHTESVKFSDDLFHYMREQKLLSNSQKPM